MNDEFVRVGSLRELTSYPLWAQSLVQECAEAKRRVVEHDLFMLMREAKLSPRAIRNFMVGVFPVIEQFPQYMALSLLKVQYGRTRGHDMARTYLIRNIRVEQGHAEYWVEWALASGVSREELIYGSAPSAAQALSHWCWHTCERDSLPASMAATNYAIEGATGEWSCLVCSQDTYENSFDPSVRKKAMKWLKMHAQYDDTHPWEALDIICTIMGNNPTTRGISLLRSCILRSYEYMKMTLDHCLLASDMEDYRSPAAPAALEWERQRAA